LRLRAPQLTGLYRAFITALGGSEDEAGAFAEQFVIADLRGMDWQGLKSLERHVVGPIRDGVIRLGRPVDLVREGPSSVVLDAHGGLGHVACRRAMAAAIEMAERTGTGSAAIHECGDTGLLGGYTTAAAERDCVGIMFNNTNAYVAPWGGAERVMGIVPFSAAIPAGEAYPVLIDMSLAKARPAFDEDAIWEPPFPTPPMLTFDTLREYALTVMVELLAGGLADMPIGLDKERRGECGVFSIAVHIPHFTDPAAFRARVDRYISHLKSAKRAQGVEEILLPGERGFRERDRRLRDGIPVSDEVWTNVVRLAEEVGVDWRTAAGIG
jgi:ureidoglycolate dehydrogenase (NAD+)